MKRRLCHVIVFVISGLLVASMCTTTSASAHIQWACKGWREANTPYNFPPGNSELLAVQALSVNDAWAVGNDTDTGNSILEHWDGQNWRVIHELQSISLYALSAITADSIWAAGANQSGKAVTTHWNGAHWQVVPTPRSGEQSSFNGIAALSIRNVWAVGTFVHHHTNSPLIEHWDGASWSLVQASKRMSGRLLAISASAPTDLWAVGDTSAKQDGSPTGRLLIEHWDGVSWHVVSTSHAPQGTLYTVAAVNARDAWAGGFDGQSMYHWDGHSWSLVKNADPLGAQFYVRSIITSSPSNVWAAGTGVGFPPMDFISVIEHWNGTLWTFEPTFAPGVESTLYAIAQVPGSQHLWAVGTIQGSSSTSFPLILTNC